MSEKLNKPAQRADQIGNRPKRFWKAAGAGAVEGGFGVALDGRAVKTPDGVVMVVPSESLAQAIAAEWGAVAAYVDYDSMPLTRLAYAAIDRMPTVQDETVTEVLRYAETDLLCYPSAYPEALTAREAAAWDPILFWAGHDLGLNFHQNLTLIHKPQPQATLEILAALVRGMTPYEQAGLMTATPLFGSVILALALWDGRLDGAAAFAASRIGEDFHAEIWGRDAEADKRSAAMEALAVNLQTWFEALR